MNPMSNTELLTQAKTAQTERKRLNDVLEMLPVYVVLLSEDYHVPFANRFFRERFGESAGRRCFEYLFNRTEPCEICDTYKVLKTGSPHRWEWCGPDGRSYDIYDFPFTDTDGSRLILEMGIDITENRMAAAELDKHRHHLERLVQERTAQLEAANAQLRAEVLERQRAQEQVAALNQDLKRRVAELQTVFDTAPIGLSIAEDPQGQHIRGNPANERLVGVPSGAELSKAAPGPAGYRVFQEGRELPVEELPMQRAVRGEPVAGQMVDVVRSDGQTVTLISNAAPLFDEQGRPRGAVGAFLDITALKRAERELRTQAEQLQAGNAELERFNRAMTGRELRMIELKKEVNELCARLGEAPRYALDFEKEGA